MQWAPSASTSDRPAVDVRPMRPEERDAVRRLFRQSFPLVQRLFFSWGDEVLVAEHDGRPIGAVVLDSYPLPGGGRGGLVSWIFTDARARGLGAGRRLLEAALERFAARGADEVTATVAGYNPSSSKLFATQGFSILPPAEQLRRYGWRLLTMWLRTTHLPAIGQFLWGRPAAAHHGSPSAQWLGTLVVNALITLLVLWRGGGLGPLAAAAVPLLYLAFLGVRWAAMRWAASGLGLDVRYRTWESALLLSLVVGLALGGLFPVPGGMYPLTERWSYRELVPKLGPMALAGAVAVAMLTLVAWALPFIAGVGRAVAGITELAVAIGGTLVLFDVVLVFFPFVAYNGRRILDWSRPVWAALAAITLGGYLAWALG